MIRSSLAEWVAWEDLARARAELGSYADKSQRERWKRYGSTLFVAAAADTSDPYECLGGES